MVSIQPEHIHVEKLYYYVFQFPIHLEGMGEKVRKCHQLKQRQRANSHLVQRRLGESEKGNRSAD